MPNPIGPDGIDVSGYGWTNQSTQFNSNKTLESGGPASSSTLNAALRQGYSAWSFDPIFATGSGISAATTLAVLFYVPQSFTCANFDCIPISTAGNLTVALWPATAPAGTATPLAWSAATAASLASVNTLTFNGSSSPLTVSLTGGNSYFATIFSSAATLMADVLAGQIYTANAAVSGTYSASTLYRSATVGTVTTVSAASVFGTSTLAAAVPWVGLH